MTFDSSISSPQDLETQAALGRIKERTDGLLDIKISPIGELPIKGADQLRAVSAGEVAMFYLFGGYHRGDAPVLKMTDIPFTWNDEYEKTRVFYETLPIIEREMNKLNIHVFAGSRSNDKMPMLLAEPVDSIMDLGKLKIRSYGEANAKVIEAMNGIPTAIAWGEVFTALERGTTEGVCTGWGPMYHAKFQEVAPYGYNLSFMTNLIWFAVNKDMWEALPEDVQDIVTEELNRAGALNLSLQPLYEAELAGMMLASGLKEWNPGPPPPEFFEVMREKVTTPLLAEAIEELGPLGEELLQAMEKALGRKIIE